MTMRSDLKKSRAEERFLCELGPRAHLLEGVQVAQAPRVAFADAPEDGDQVVLRAGRALHEGSCRGQQSNAVSHTGQRVVSAPC